MYKEGVVMVDAREQDEPNPNIFREVCFVRECETLRLRSDKKSLHMSAHGYFLISLHKSWWVHKYSY
jgi:hypothetical protein